jgi:two-component system LytT family response regulator
LIIDDEEDARESLRLLLGKFCPEVEILEICAGPKEGLKAIEAHSPDLVFLDVQMPHMSGFDMLEKIKAPSFQTVFVTAHDKYAIKAIRFSALDYLMKPVDVDDLVSAVARAGSIEDEEKSSGYESILHNVRNRLGQEGKLAVPTSDGMEFIDLKDIVYCTADGSYTALHMDGRKDMLISKSLKDFEGILDPSVYCRVHHGSIINLGHISKYVKGEGGYAIMSNGEHVDISRRKKEEFMRLISKI